MIGLGPVGVKRGKCGHKNGLLVGQDHEMGQELQFVRGLLGTQHIGP